MENENEELHFYYNREERIANANPTVKAYYDGTAPQPPHGFFEALVHTRASRCALAALVLSLALFLGIYFLGSKTYIDTLNGDKFTLTAFSFEDKIYVSLKMDKEYENDFSVQFCTIDNDDLTTDKVSFSKFEVQDLYLRTVFQNYDTMKIAANIKDEETNQEIKLWCKVEKK